MTSTPVQVRFADVDMAGHVHNAAYLHYFESARLDFFVKKLGENWDWKKNGFILKKNTVEYVEPVHLSDTIRVHIHVRHIGTKSFTLGYEVIDSNKRIKTTGESLIVCFDYSSGQTITIPDAVRKALNDLEPGPSAQ